MLFVNFNEVHLSYLIILFGLGIALYQLLHHKSKKVQRIFMLALILTCSIIKMHNMFRYVKYGWETIFSNLPLYICSLNVFILPWLIISKERHPVMAHYLAFIAIPGATFSMFFPGVSENKYPFYSPILLETFYTHAVYISVATFYLIFNNYRISKKYVFPVAVLITEMSICGHFVNEILIYTQINPFANYMFTEYGLAGTPLVWLNDIIPVKLVYLLVGYYLMLLIRFCSISIRDNLDTDKRKFLGDHFE